MLLHTVGALPIGVLGCAIKVAALFNLASQLRDFFGGLLTATLMCGGLTDAPDGLWVSGNVSSTALGA